MVLVIMIMPHGNDGLRDAGYGIHGGHVVAVYTVSKNHEIVLANHINIWYGLSWFMTVMVVVITRFMIMVGLRYGCCRIHGGYVVI